MATELMLFSSTKFAAAEYDLSPQTARPDWLALREVDAVTDPIDSPIGNNDNNLSTTQPFRTPLPTMLSNPPPSGLHARHRQHRRQNSTPSAFEAMKIASNLPEMHSHQQPQLQRPQGRPRVSHRRGMSLDTRRQQMHPSTFRQDFHNTQQRIARPGSHQQAYANLASDENYLISPHTTPQMQGFEGQCFDGLPGPQNMNMSFDMYNGQMNVMMKRNQEGFSDNARASQDFELFPSSTMSTPTFMSFSESPSGAPAWMSEGESSTSRRSSRRVSNGIMDRVAKFENMDEGSQRPLTPPHQNAQDYFPLTPMDTPHNRTIKHGRRPQRFMDEYDESMEETVKPNRQMLNRRSRTTFDELRQASESQTFEPTPRRPNSIAVSGMYDISSTDGSFVDANQFDAVMAMPTQFDGLPGSSHPLSAESGISQQNSPMTPHMAGFNGPFDMKPDLRPPESALDALSGNGSQDTEKPSRRSSPHRRTESVASIASAASIASLDIEQTKTTTGITIDDIHQFIQGPEPRDNKWVCTFEDCNKRFGRKENIKSHVQTHLNDRQYKCPTCTKCFVRQHDLKRHAKIHTGIKPYPCECGNSFARHDALTRHKQRGMCIGAFDGVVRKVVKRGRPRKHRPDMDERKEKSTRTRKKNQSVSSVSSQSGYSDSSAANSPETIENIDQDFEMLDELMEVSMGGTIQPSSLQGLGSSSAPMPSLSAHLAANAHSPSTHSIHSYVSQMSHMSLHADPSADMLPSHPASPAKSVASQYNEPPELSQSSSPPSSGRFFDVDPSSSHSDMMLSSAMDNASIPTLAGMADNEDDLLLQFTHGDPMLMLSSDSKFEEAFNPVNMYENSNDDLYFGTS
ncbi:hypothetical protein JX266_004625 [Neoarthrinium moseri]|nr:hypothetical protein JX266_004625 [Neoarthrinium moseri]